MRFHSTLFLVHKKRLLSNFTGNRFLKSLLFHMLRVHSGSHRAGSYFQTCTMLIFLFYVAPDQISFFLESWYKARGNGVAALNALRIHWKSVWNSVALNLMNLLNLVSLAHGRLQWCALTRRVSALLEEKCHNQFHDTCERPYRATIVPESSRVFQALSAHNSAGQELVCRATPTHTGSCTATPFSRPRDNDHCPRPQKYLKVMPYNNRHSKIPHCPLPGRALSLALEGISSRNILLMKHKQLLILKSFLPVWRCHHNLAQHLLSSFSLRGSPSVRAVQWSTGSMDTLQVPI